MKFNIDKNIFISGLSKVQNTVSNRPTLPVLNNVLLNIIEDKLKLTTTDLEITVSTTIPVEVVESGNITLPVKKLVTIVKQMPENNISLELNDNNIIAIKSGKSSFNLQGISAQEFPENNEMENSREFKYNALKLKKILDKISYAKSSDKTRYVLNSSLLSIREGTLTCVATDGRRLAILEDILDSDESLEGDSILPSKLVDELTKLLLIDEEIIIKISSVSISFESKNTYIESKLIEGVYPNYRQIIPESFKYSVSLSRKDFNDSIQRVSVILSSDPSSFLKINLVKDLMTVSASLNTDHGQEPLDVIYDGKEFNFSFNPQFILDPLKNLENEEIIIRFNDNLSPIGIYGDEGFLYMIMPMRN